MQKGFTYKNIINGVEVRILDVYESKNFGSMTVAYFNTARIKDFIKPLYVFEKTYVKI